MEKLVEFKNGNVDSFGREEGFIVGGTNINSKAGIITLSWEKVLFISGTTNVDKVVGTRTESITNALQMKSRNPNGSEEMIINGYEADLNKPIMGSGVDADGNDLSLVIIGYEDDLSKPILINKLAGAYDVWVKILKQEIAISPIALVQGFILQTEG